MSFSEAEALTRIFPYLVRLVLPKGAIDLARKMPVSDTALVATTNVLLARKDVHPAIVDLLAQTTLQAHSTPGLFRKVGEFPTETDPEYPISQGARDFYRNGPSFLNRYLPFWMTNYAQRFLAVLVAVIAIVVPVFNYAPKLFLWLIRDRVRRLYRRLRMVDKALLSEDRFPPGCRRSMPNWKTLEGRPTSSRCIVPTSFLSLELTLIGPDVIWHRWKRKTAQPRSPDLPKKPNGAPEGIRTPDPQIRSLVLYPAELPAPWENAGAPPEGSGHHINAVFAPPQFLPSSGQERWRSKGRCRKDNPPLSSPTRRPPRRQPRTGWESSFRPCA